MTSASGTWTLTWHDRLRSRLQRQPWGLVANVAIAALLAGYAFVFHQLGSDFFAGIVAAIALGGLGLTAVPIWGGGSAQLTAEVDELGLRLKMPGVVSLVEWPELTHTPLPDYLMLCRGRRCIALIPKRAFDPSAYSAFHDVVQAHTEEYRPMPVEPGELLVLLILIVGLVSVAVSAARLT